MFRGDCAPDEGDVDPREVVDREHAAALARDPVEPVARGARVRKYVSGEIHSREVFQAKSP